MSEDSDPQDDQQTHDLRGEIPGDAGWESPAYRAPERSAPEGERMMIELPAKRRRSPRRAATHARGGNLERWAPWLSVASAVLAACFGIALALARPGVREPARQPTAARPCALSHRSDIVREHARPPKRRAHSASTRGAAIPAGSQSSAATAPRPPRARSNIAGHPAPEPPPEAPATQARTEGETEGGPFSP
jgi:hypothetical protein